MDRTGLLSMAAHANTSYLDRLRTDARYARERRDLYRARAYGPRMISPARLRDLEASG